MSHKYSGWPTQSALPVATLVVVSAAFSAWAAFCYVVATVPLTFDRAWLRLTVRILSVLIPALIFRLVVGGRQGSSPASHSPTVEELFCFRNRWVLGLVTGIVVAATYLIVMFLDPTRQLSKPPGTLTAWLSMAAIPVADEMLFRCVLAVQIYAISQSLDGAKGWDSWIAAVILSSAVFAAFDLPEWLITAPLALELVVRLAIEFGLGCVLAILFLFTRSIWASLIPHWAYVLFWQLAGT